MMNSLMTPPGLSRRGWLAWGAAATLASGLTGRALAAAAETNVHALRLAAAWEGAQGYQVGVLALDQAGLGIAGALDVPTRAHGVWQEKSGTLLAASQAVTVAASGCGM